MKGTVAPPSSSSTAATTCRSSTPSSAAIRGVTDTGCIVQVPDPRCRPARAVTGLRRPGTLITCRTVRVSSLASTWSSVTISRREPRFRKQHTPRSTSLSRILVSFTTGTPPPTHWSCSPRPTSSPWAGCTRMRRRPAIEPSGSTSPISMVRRRLWCWSQPRTGWSATSHPRSRGWARALASPPALSGRREVKHDHFNLSGSARAARRARRRTRRPAGSARRGPARGHPLAAAQGVAAGRRPRHAEPPRRQPTVRPADARRARTVADRGGVPDRPRPDRGRAAAGPDRRRVTPSRSSYWLPARRQYGDPASWVNGRRRRSPACPRCSTAEQPPLKRPFAGSTPAWGAKPSSTNMRVLISVRSLPRAGSPRHASNLKHAGHAPGTGTLRAAQRRAAAPAPSVLNLEAEEPGTKTKQRHAKQRRQHPRERHRHPFCRGVEVGNYRRCLRGPGSKERCQSVANNGRRLLGWSLVAVNPQNVEPGLHQPFGCLSVEMHFGVAAAGRELEAVVRAACVQSFGDHLGVGFENHGQVGPVSLGVELPEEGRVDAVEALHDQPRRDVAIADDGLAFV